MKVGLMADSHDRVPAIAELLGLMREGGATMVLLGGLRTGMYPPNCRRRSCR